MTYVLAALLQGGSQSSPPSMAGSTAVAPQVIYWIGAGPAELKTEIGLLYTPEVLAALARRSPSVVSERVNDAIRQQTAIVLLWTIPPIGGEPPVPRPFSAVIVERGGYSAVPRTEPLWIQQHAKDIRQLDPQRPFQEVGGMAGFNRSAFVPGHFVIHSPEVTFVRTGRVTRRATVRARRMERSAATGSWPPLMVRFQNGAPTGPGRAVPFAPYDGQRTGSHSSSIRIATRSSQRGRHYPFRAGLRLTCPPEGPH